MSTVRFVAFWRALCSACNSHRRVHWRVHCRAHWYIHWPMHCCIHLVFTCLFNDISPDVFIGVFTFALPIWGQQRVGTRGQMQDSCSWHTVEFWLNLWIKWASVRYILDKLSIQRIPLGAPTDFQVLEWPFQVLCSRRHFHPNNACLRLGHWRGEVLDDCLCVYVHEKTY